MAEVAVEAEEEVAAEAVAPTVTTSSRWYLYDEKFVMSGKGKYDAKRSQEWLQAIRDYVAGRTAELDPLLDWVEKQVEEIPCSLGQGSAPLVDAAPSI